MISEPAIESDAANILESPRFSARAADRLFFVFCTALTILQLLAVALTPLALSPDEAHYWEWSRRLDFAYYSKGPLVALLIRTSTSLLGDTAFAVRFPAILCTLFFSICFYRFVRREHSAQVAFLSWLLLRTSLLVTGVGYAMTTDAPMVLLWLLGIIVAQGALRGNRTSSWILFGLICGLAVWAKYTAFALPLGVGLLLLFNPNVRAKRIGRGVSCAAVTFFLMLLPLLYWNMRHGWVNLAHNATHVVRESGIRLSLHSLPELFFGQMALLGPVLFFVLLRAIWSQRGVLRSSDSTTALYWSLTAPLVVLCFGLSFTKSIYANWPLPAYISGIFLVIEVYPKLFEQALLKRSPYRMGLGFNALGLLGAHLFFFGATLGIPAQILPTKKLIGWQDLGSRVESVLRLHQSNPEPFVIADNYGVASAIAFYAPSHPELMCANSGERRMNQYDLWGGWEEKRGRDALLVLPEPELVENFKAHFKSLSPVSTLPFQVNVNQRTLREYYFFWGTEYDGFAPLAPSRT